LRSHILPIGSHVVMHMSYVSQQLGAKLKEEPRREPLADSAKYLSEMVAEVGSKLSPIMPEYHTKP